MEKKTRRERDKEKMRRRILDAAKTLFAKEGFENVSIRSIAKKIEYSPAAIYRYFKNKREMLSVLREEGFARYVAEKEAFKKQYPDPMERMRHGGRQYVEFALREPEYYELMFCTDCEQVEMEGELAASAKRSYEMLLENVQECVDTGHFGEQERDTVALALWSTVHGLAHLMKTGRIPVKSQSELVALLDKVTAFDMRPGDGNNANT